MEEMKMSEGTPIQGKIFLLLVDYL